MSHTSRLSGLHDLPVVADPAELNGDAVAAFAPSRARADHAERVLAELRGAAA